MQVTEVGITVSKMISDRNYGSEKTEVHWVVQIGEMDDPEVTTRQVLGDVRALMLEDLGNSHNAAIRSDAQPPKAVAGRGGEADPF
jgi:hypothetical protein